MTLSNASALYLLALAAGIILLYFLRARSQRYEVSALFLWEGLRSEPSSRAARIRRRIEPLLLVQLLVLALVTLALADPALRVPRPRLTGMAIVLDGSASMQTRTKSTKTRYELAREEGLALLNRYPSTPVTVLQLSKSPQVLVPLTDDHDSARHALASSQPTWQPGGSVMTLEGLLDSQGELGGFERIILFTDRPLAERIPGVEEVVLAGGENLAITSFTVREDPDLHGAAAFLKVQNDTSSYQERTVRVDDGSNQVLLSLLLPPGGEQAYVLPFPGSRGPTFTAALEPGDAFFGDDTRYFTLKRGLDRRIRWVGENNRYLEAALRAAGPITFVSIKDSDPVDLTVAYNALLPAETNGNILLIHADLEGLVTIGEDREAGKLAVVSPNDPLLTGVDALDFRVRSAPLVDLAKAGTTVLSLGKEPFLYCLEEEKRKVVLIAPDLMSTNLPLTIDFPLLVRNLLELFLPLPTPLTHRWAIVGEPVRIDGYGALRSLTAPSGREISLASGARSFYPQEPGIYTLSTEKGIYALAVNVDPAESEPPDALIEAQVVTPVKEQTQALLPLWPYFAVTAFLALLVEAFLYHGWQFKRWWR